MICLSNPQPAGASPAEEQVLCLLWDCAARGLPQLSVRELRVEAKTAGLRWATTTLATLLARLYAKGLVERHLAEDRSLSFSAKLSYATYRARLNEALDARYPPAD